MSYFILIYFAVILGCAALAAYNSMTKLFSNLFMLAIFSILIGLIFGASGISTLSIIVGIFIGCIVVAYCFREFLSITLPTELAKTIRSAPLTATFGLFVVLIYILAAIFAPWIAPYGESEVVGATFAPSSKEMLLGGDQLGRDMYSRIIYGARNTVGLSLAATFCAFLIGATLGLFAATKGGRIDQLIARSVDVLMSIPQLIFGLLLLSVFGVGMFNIILVVTIVYTPPVFRLARAVAGNIVVMDYIEAAKLRGEGSWYLIRKEILPNAMAPLIAEFGLRFCFVFLLLAALSFLGLGIQPPTADWGSMVRENATLVSFGEVTPLIPAAAIALLTVSVNFIVDWMLYRSSGLKT